MMLMLLPAPSSGNISCVDRPFFSKLYLLLDGLLGLRGVSFPKWPLLMISYQVQYCRLERFFLLAVVSTPSSLIMTVGSCNTTLETWGDEPERRGKAIRALPDIELERELYTLRWWWRPRSTTSAGVNLWKGFSYILVQPISSLDGTIRFFQYTV